MDRDDARKVLAAAFRSAAELQELLPMLKQRCDQQAYEAYAKGIASVVGEIVLQVTNRVFEDHPELRAEVDASVATTGRYP
jgi:hypothetical protein